MPSYEALKQTADERWRQLTAGDSPWIRVGAAMCGQSAGALEVLDAIRREIDRRGVSARVDEVGCLGICYAEPLVDVRAPGAAGRLFFSNVSPEDVPDIIESYLVGGRVPERGVLGWLGDDPPPGAPDLAAVRGIAAQKRIALRNAGNTAPSDIYQYIANGGYAGIYKAISEMEPDDVIGEVRNSGLRGRGGAAFPTGVKWSFMSRGGGTKYMLCNCEEGDPGAYNDKGILESDPHTLLEGLMIGGYATRATNGIVFIRHGHDGPIDRTEEAIKQAYEAGALGENIFGTGFSFDIEVALTGESYVAGEETALMEAIEGKRSQPRYRPPFPAAYGVWGHPSTINNVKTYSYTPQIISRGAEWFKSVGTESSAGTAIICLNGNVRYPGLYEVPMGLTLGEVVNDIGGGVPDGKSLKLLQTGGPLGGVLSAESMSIRIDFDEMRSAGAILGSGGIIVGDEDVCAVDLTRVLVAFCQFESCGKCFPCRLGMEHLLEITERIARCESRPGDLDMMRSVGATMEAGSLCGHGQLGFGPIRSALNHFEEDFIAHIEERRCPTGSCLVPHIVPKSARPYAHDFQPGARNG